jgi:hypothetical protein
MRKGRDVFSSGRGARRRANADQRLSTVFNANLQVGVSYWMSPNLKLSASYRLDAWFNVLTGLSAVNDPIKLQTMDRYVHGPRVGVSAQRAQGSIFSNPRDVAAKPHFATFNGKGAFSFGTSDERQMRGWARLGQVAGQGRSVSRIARPVGGSDV